MTWAATTFAFFVFPRLRGLTCNSTFSSDIHLSLGDVSFRPSWGNPEHPSVRIKGTKTDPFPSGQIILIGKTNESVCPVKAMKTSISVRNSTSGHLFKRLGNLRQKILSRQKQGNFFHRLVLTYALREIWG